MHAWLFHAWTTLYVLLLFTLLRDQCPYSDHFPTNISPTSFALLPNPPRWWSNRADWQTFTSYATISRPHSPSLSISDKIQMFSRTVLIAAYTATPQSFRPYMSKYVPRWNSDWTKALHLKRIAWNSYHSNETLLTNYQLLSSLKKRLPIFDVQFKTGK